MEVYTCKYHTQTLETYAYTILTILNYLFPNYPNYQTSFAAHCLLIC